MKANKEVLYLRSVALASYIASYIAAGTERGGFARVVLVWKRKMRALGIVHVRRFHALSNISRGRIDTIVAAR